MRSIVLVLVILLTETSLSFAQGHMGAAGLQTRCAARLPTAIGR